MKNAVSPSQTRILGSSYTAPDKKTSSGPTLDQGCVAVQPEDIREQVLDVVDEVGSLYYSRANQSQKHGGVVLKNHRSMVQRLLGAFSPLFSPAAVGLSAVAQFDEDGSLQGLQAQRQGRTYEVGEDQYGDKAYTIKDRMSGGERTVVERGGKVTFQPEALKTDREGYILHVQPQRRDDPDFVDLNAHILAPKSVLDEQTRDGVYRATHTIGLLPNDKLSQFKEMDGVIVPDVLSATALE